jgi:hypothetical protein
VSLCVFQRRSSTTHEPDFIVILINATTQFLDDIPLIANYRLYMKGNAGYFICFE